MESKLGLQYVPGCPSLTDSEVKRKEFSALIFKLLLLDWVMEAGKARIKCEKSPSNSSNAKVDDTRKRFIGVG